MGAFEKDHGSRSCGHALSIPEAVKGCVDTTDWVQGTDGVARNHFC